MHGRQRDVQRIGSRARRELCERLEFWGERQRALGDIDERERTGNRQSPLHIRHDQPRQQHARHLVLNELRAEWVSSSRGRVVPRGVKRKMSNFPLRPRRRLPTRRRRFRVHIVRRRRHTPAWNNPHRTTN